MLPTAKDPKALQLSLGGITLRLHLRSLMLPAVVIFLQLSRDPTHGLVMGLLDAAIVCSALIAHELGHALVLRAFGFRPTIELRMLAQTTVTNTNERPWALFLAALAGPAMSLALGAGVYASKGYFHFPADSNGESLYQIAFFVTWTFGLINLYPALPLDGGAAVRHFLHALTKRDALRRTTQVSIGALVAVGAAAVALRQWVLLLMVAMMVVQNWWLMGVAKAMEGDAVLRKGLDLALAKHGEEPDGAGLLRAAKHAVDHTRTTPGRAHALETLALAYCSVGDADRAEQALAQLPEPFRPSYSTHLHILLQRGEWQRALRDVHLLAHREPSAENQAMVEWVKANIAHLRHSAPPPPPSHPPAANGAKQIES